MGNISKQQVKVFAMFAVAFVLSAYASAFAHQGVTQAAVASAFVALGFIGQVIQETIRS